MAGGANQPRYEDQLAIAGKGWRQALQDDPHLKAGLNLHAGRVAHPAVARDLALPYHAAEQLIGG